MIKSIKKIHWFRFLVVINLMGFIFLMNVVGNTTVYAADPGSSSLPPESVSQPLSVTERQVSQQLDLQESVPVLVELDMVYQAGLESMNTVKGVNQQHTIQMKQAQVSAALSEVGVKNLHNFQFIPYMSMSINQAAFEVLLNSGAVKNILPDQLSQVSLTESIPVINADDVWAEGFRGSGQVVAVLDTGVEKTHDSLSGKIVSEACYSTNYTSLGFNAYSICPGGVTESTASNSAMPYAGACPTGKCDHGTHVAAIAAGKSGVAKDAHIIAIQVFSKIDEDGSIWVGSFSSDQIKGLERVYALRDSYSIAAVNMSLGGGSYPNYCDGSESARKAIIDALRTAGIATVIASGNDGYTSSISTPACISSAISVGATTDEDQVIYFSNSAAILDVLAPGVNIYAAIPNNLLGTKSGTSMATPHVAGAWAVIKSANPSLDVDTLENLFKDNGIPILDERNGITKPRIDLLNTFQHFIPASPTNLTAEISAQNEIILNWEDQAVNETAYQIQTDIGNLGGENWTDLKTEAANTVTSEISTFSENGEYCFRVRAANEGGNSEFSNSACVSIDNSLSPPLELSITVISDTQINLSWAAGSAEAEGYRIERSPDGAEWVEITSTTATNYVDLGLTPSTTYAYRVRAYNSTTVSAYTSTQSGTTLVLPAPTNLTISMQDDSTAALSWEDPSDGEEGFYIERRKNDEDWMLIDSTIANQTTYTDTGLEPGNHYDYRVFGFTHSSQSLVSNQITVTPLVKVFIPLVLR